MVHIVQAIAFAHEMHTNEWREGAFIIPVQEVNVCFIMFIAICYLVGASRENSIFYFFPLRTAHFSSMYGA